MCVWVHACVRACVYYTCCRYSGMVCKNTGVVKVNMVFVVANIFNTAS